MSRHLTLEKSFEEYAAEADSVFDIHGPDAWRYYDFIPSHAVMARPQGGCLKLRTAATGKFSYDYNDSEGEFCWPSRAQIKAEEDAAKIQAMYKARPELFAPEADSKADIFEAFYGKRNLSVEEFDQMNLSGFFGSLKRAFTPPRTVRNVVKKAVRYAGAVQFGTFMPAQMRKKTFGLSDKESGQFEKLAKVTRGTLAAVAVVTTGGAALSAMKAAGAAKAGAGAAGGMIDLGSVSTQGVANLTPGQALISKVADGVIKVSKSVGGQLLVQKFASWQIPNQSAIPQGGFVADSTFDDRPGTDALPAYPAGGSFPPLDPAYAGDEELKDALGPTSASEKPASASPLILVGLGLAALFVLRRKQA